MYEQRFVLKQSPAAARVLFRQTRAPRVSRNGKTRRSGLLLFSRSRPRFGFAVTQTITDRLYRLPETYRDRKQRPRAVDASNLKTDNARVVSTLLSLWRVWFFVSRRSSSHGNACDSDERRTRFVRPLSHGPFLRRMTTKNGLCVHTSAATSICGLREEEKVIHNIKRRSSKVFRQ